MSSYLETSTTVEAEVHETLPRFGLAYVVDETARTWGITRSMPGLDFESLSPGRRVRLRIDSTANFSVVRECRLAD